MTDVIIWVKELLKFKTANDRLIAVLFGLLIVMGIVSKTLYEAGQRGIEFERNNRIVDRNYYGERLKEKDVLIAKVTVELDESRNETLECERNSTKFAQKLLAEQTEVNAKNGKVTTAQLNTAKEVRQLVKTDIKEKKIVIDKLKRSKP